MKKPAREFDYKELFEAYPELNLQDKNSYGLVEAGARWQFNKDLEEIERLEAEIIRLHDELHSWELGSRGFP